MPHHLLALNHVGVRTTRQKEMEHFYIDVLGMQPHPIKRNWLLVNDTYAVHLMPPLAELSDEAAYSVDAARHFALQVRLQALLAAAFLACCPARSGVCFRAVLRSASCCKGMCFL